MAFTKKPARQEEIVAVADVVVADITESTFLPMIDLPIGAFVTGGGLYALTAFSSTTHDHFSIGDDAADDTYAATSADKKDATGSLAAIVPTGAATTADTTVGVLWTNTAEDVDSVVGELRLIVTYVVTDREHHTQG